MAFQPTYGNKLNVKESCDCSRRLNANITRTTSDPNNRMTTVNELDLRKSTGELIAEMSSAFDRFVSHFRDLEATVTCDNAKSPGIPVQSSTTCVSCSGITNGPVKSNLPHEKELHLALKKAGLTWDDYSKAMRQIEEDSSFAQCQITQHGNFSAERSDKPASILVHSHEHGDRSVHVHLPASQTTPRMMSSCAEHDSVPIFEGDSTCPTNLTMSPTINEKLTGITELQSTNCLRNEEMKKNLERQLEETRKKKWAFYNDILKSSEQWRTSSRDMDATTTTMTSKCWDVLRESEEQRLSPEVKATYQEHLQISPTLSDSLEKELAHERDIIKMRMAELERFRMEEEARLKRLEQMAREARLSRKSKMAAKLLECRDPHVFKQVSPNESKSARPQSADALHIRSPSCESCEFSHHSSLKSVGVVHESNHECLKIKDITSKLKWADPVRPATALGVYSTERELRPMEMENVLTPVYRNLIHQKPVQKRSSSDSRRSFSLSSKRSSSLKRRLSSRDSDTSAAHLPILFTKKLDKSLEEISPYAAPEATSNTKTANISAPIIDEIGIGPENKTTGDPKQVKRNGPLEPRVGCETKHKQLLEVQSLPDLDREFAAIRLPALTVKSLQTEKTKLTSVLTRSEPSNVLPLNDVVQDLPPVDDFGYVERHAIKRSQSYPVLNNNQIALLSNNRTIPVQINLDGKQISSPNLPVAPPTAFSTSEADQRNQTAIDLTNTTCKRSKQKSYQINIKLDLNRALRYYDRQRQQFLSPTQLQVPESPNVTTVERTSEINYEGVNKQHRQKHPEQLSKPGIGTSLQSPSPSSPSTQSMNPIRSIEIVPILGSPPQSRPESSRSLHVCGEHGIGSQTAATVGIKPQQHSLDRPSVCNLNHMETMNESQTQPKEISGCTTNLHQGLTTSLADFVKVPLMVHRAQELKSGTNEMLPEVTKCCIDPVKASIMPGATNIPEHFRSNLPKFSSETDGASQSDLYFYSMTTVTGQITKSSQSIPPENTSSSRYFSVSKHVDACATTTVPEARTCQVSTQTQKSSPITWNNKSGSTVEMQEFGTREVNNQKQHPGSCIVEPSVSITQSDPKGNGESVDSSKSLTLQVGLNRCLKSHPHTFIESDGPMSKNIIPALATLKNQPLTSSAVNPFNSQHSFTRDDDLSRSSNRGDNTSGQIRPTQEQLCLWSISDPMNATDTHKEVESTSSSTSVDELDDWRTEEWSFRPGSGFDNKRPVLATMNATCCTVSTHPFTAVCKTVNRTEGYGKQSTATTNVIPALTNVCILDRLKLEQNNNYSCGTYVNIAQEACSKEAPNSQLVFVNSLISPVITQEQKTDSSDLPQRKSEKSCILFGDESVQKSQTSWNNNSSAIQENGSFSHNDSLNIPDSGQCVMPVSFSNAQESQLKPYPPCNPVTNEPVLELERNWVNALRQFQSSIGSQSVQHRNRTIPHKRITNNICQSDRINLSSLLDSAQASTDIRCSDETKPKSTLPLGLSAKQSCLGFDTNCIQPTFDYLRVVQLVQCNLTPDMLIGVAQLTQLEALNISHNQLNYLECIHGAFPKLAILDVSNNCFEELEHLGGPFPSLRKLNISSNLLSTVNQIQQVDLMPHLHVLDVRDNLITQTENIQLPVGFSGQLNVGGNQLRHLDESYTCRLLTTHLDLSRNLLCELPGNGLHGPILNHLDLSQNNLQSLDSLSRSWLPHLHTLKADENRINEIPALQCSKLGVLSLQNNQIKDLSHLGAALKVCSKLRVLNLQHNPCCLDKQFSHKVFQALSNLAQLNDNPNEIFGDVECPTSLSQLNACSNCLSSCCYEEEFYRFSHVASWRWTAISIEC